MKKIGYTQYEQKKKTQNYDDDLYDGSFSQSTLVTSNNISEVCKSVFKKHF